MSEADTEESDTTKTVVLDNDVHTALKGLANIRDSSITAVTDEVLRSSEAVQKELRLLEERRS